MERNTLGLLFFKGDFMRKKRKSKKPYLGRIPIPRPGTGFKDKNKYSRKDKHKKEESNDNR
jgi:hypothetical protein